MSENQYHVDFHKCRIAELPETNLAYLAGILDGEGYFCASTNSNTSLRVSSIDRVLIDWLSERFVGNHHEYVNKRGRRVYEWKLQRQADILFLLPRVQRYLVIKPRQAAAMFELVTHLQAFPRWTKPTTAYRSTDPERSKRRAEKQAWAARTAKLRQAVSDARRIEQA